MEMRTLQAQHSNYIDSRYRSVDDFLHHCHLDQYLDIFLSEGFDSVTSLLEITEDDMIFMNVKRGHRRLIQREIANVKGIPSDQPLITNTMGTKYDCQQELMSNAPIKNELRRINRSSSSSNLYNNRNALMTNNLPVYDNIATGLTSPRSMNSGIGGNSSASSGNNSSSGPMRSRMHQPQQSSVQVRSSVDSGNSSMINDSPSSFLGKPNISSNNNSNNNQNETVQVRSNSISSNDDADSIDTNESVPTKRKYRRHAKPDRNAPIKPPSAYIMFSNDSRAELKNKNLSFAELAKIVGDQWKNLSHMEKQSYERRAMRAKDEYLAALEQYRQTPQYHRYQEYLSEFKSKQNASNRSIGRARKRAKQASPGSGSIADSSSNGNSNGNGSSGSGSADTYGDKESVMRRQRQTSEDEAAQLSSQQEQIPSSSINRQAQKNFSKYNATTNNNAATNVADTLRPIYNHHHHQRPSLQQQQQHQSSDSGYTSQSYYNGNADKASQWNHRSNQIMRGMLPVEFVLQNPASDAALADPLPQKSPAYNTRNIINDVDMEDDQEDNEEADEDVNVSPSTSYEKKRRSPRFNKSQSKSKSKSNIQKA